MNSLAVTRSNTFHNIVGSLGVLIILALMFIRKVEWRRMLVGLRRVSRRLQESNQQRHARSLIRLETAAALFDEALKKLLGAKYSVRSAVLTFCVTVTCVTAINVVWDVHNSRLYKIVAVGFFALCVASVRRAWSSGSCVPAMNVARFVSAAAVAMVVCREFLFNGDLYRSDLQYWTLITLSVLTIDTGATRHSWMTIVDLVCCFGFGFVAMIYVRWLIESLKQHGSMARSVMIACATATIPGILLRTARFSPTADSAYAAALRDPWVGDRNAFLLMSWRSVFFVFPVLLPFLWLSVVSIEPKFTTSLMGRLLVPAEHGILERAIVYSVAIAMIMWGFPDLPKMEFIRILFRLR